MLQRTLTETDLQLITNGRKREEKRMFTRRRGTKEEMNHNFYQRNGGITESEKCNSLTNVLANITLPGRDADANKYWFFFGAVAFLRQVLAAQAAAAAS